MSVSYTYEEWAALCSEVERQGGALLPDACSGRVLTFKEPKSDKITKAKTCHCDNESMFVTVYAPSDDAEEELEMRQRGAGFARVCGVCDFVGAWPTFEHVIKDDLS